MTKRLFTLAMMFICAFGAWADDWYGKIDFRSWAAESITSGTLTLSLDGTEINNTGLYLLNNPTANVDGKSDLNLHGRIALTTLTPSNNKNIDIRNNGSGNSSTGLRNYQGAATTLSILDLKEGDRVKIICSEEAVKITPTNSHKVLGEANTEEVIWTSGDIYVMDEDGRLDVSFGDGSSQKYIYSIEITEKPASIVYDFARAESIVINSTGDTNPKLYYGDGSSTSNQSYYSIDTPNTNSRVGWSATTNITKVDGGMKVTSGNRYLAIKNLQLGETIRIGYIGGTLKCALYNNSGTRGDIISKNGTALSAGDVISSNDELTVTNVDDTYNYVVFLPDNNCVISQIYLNSQETVSTPSISTEAGDGETTVTITGGTSSPESNSVKTYYTTDGNDPTTDSNLYTEPFSVSSGCMVKAISISATGTESTTASEEVTVTAISRAITIGTHNNGSLETSVTEATKETIVTITATPNNGYYLSSITITKTEDETQYMKITDGSNTFEMPAYAVTVSATFMRTQYTITYDLNGGSVATDNPTTYDVNTTTFTLTNPIKEGYTFAGWTGTGLDAATTIVTIAKGSTGNREYTATWNQEAPASYDIIVTQPEAGGTVGVKVGNVEVTTANTTATADQIITLSNRPAENYTFTTYSVTKTSGGAAVEVTDGSFTMPAEGVTVTAVFEPTAHVHNFIYAVGTGDNTNILIATCQNPSCNLTDNKATLTLTAEGGTYNGSAFSATTDVDAFNVATGLSATVSINYTGDNSYNSTDAPTNAGTYIATATVTIGDTNYTLNKSFTIAKASITELTITELDAPVKGTALDTEVVCSTTGIESASVVWKKGETDATGNAEASTVYTAIVTLTASSNYVFAESPTVNAISEKAGAVTRNNDTQISVAYTFDATTADDPVTPTLTVNVDDASHGSVTIIVAGEAASSGVAVAEGASVSVTATANSGYTFKNWGNTELTANPYNFTMGTSDVNLTATFEEESKVNAEQTWTFNSITTGTQYKSIVEIGNGLYIRGSNGRSLSVSESDAAETITFSDNHEEEVSKTLVAANVPNGNAPTTAGNANGILGTIALNINTAGTLYIKLKAGNFDNHTDNPRLRLQNSSGTLNQVTPTDGTTIYELKYSFGNASVAYLNTAGNIFLNIYAIRFVPTPEATITADATQSKTYNGTAQALTASASAGGVTITYYTNADHSEGETTTAPTNAGTYYAIVSQSDANYISTPVNVTFTIQPKDLTITAKNQTVSIGGSITDGVGLVTTNGLVEGDELTGITLAASSTEAATESGTITPSNAVIKNGASNYNISYVAGTLTVVAGTQSYNIVVPSAVNGNSVSANPTSATEGTGITLTITTAENYTLSSINADNNVELSGSGETRTFTMPAANVTITATWTVNQADTGDNATSETYTVTETGGIEVSSVTTNINSSSITIPAKVGSANVTSIANDAFDNVAKENIRSIDLSATSITGVTVNRSSGIFNGFPEETMIYMPAGNTEASGQKNVIIGGTCSDFVMTDEKSYNIPTSFTAMSATLSRSFTSDVTCTLCLPYAIPAATIASFGKIYYFSGINGTTIQMTEQTGDLEANTPYIFVPNNAATGITTTGSISVSMSDAETHNNTAKFTFKGVYEHKVFSSTEISSGVYGFAADADHGATSVGQFVKASNGAWTEGMRAYLAYSGNLSETGVATTRGEGLPEYLNVVLVSASGSTTNIGRLELMTAEDGSPVYNLNGQRVDNSYKGIVIKNGKKVIKK